MAGSGGAAVLALGPDEDDFYAGLLASFRFYNDLLARPKASAPAWCVSGALPAASPSPD